MPMISLFLAHLVGFCKEGITLFVLMLVLVLRAVVAEAAVTVEGRVVGEMQTIIIIIIIIIINK